jgi:hypothetical protein
VGELLRLELLAVTLEEAVADDHIPTVARLGSAGGVELLLARNVEVARPGRRTREGDPLRLTARGRADRSELGFLHARPVNGRALRRERVPVAVGLEDGFQPVEFILALLAVVLLAPLSRRRPSEALDSSFVRATQAPPRRALPTRPPVGPGTLRREWVGLSPIRS